MNDDQYLKEENVEKKTNFRTSWRLWERKRG